MKTHRPCIRQLSSVRKLVDGTQSEGAPYGFAIMNESNQELLDMINAGLADIKANGTYDEIIATYVGE